METKKKDEAEKMNPAVEQPKIKYNDDNDVISLADSSIYELYDRVVEHFPSGSVFVELGVFEGGSILYLAQKIKESGKDIKVYAVDIWENVVAELEINGVIHKNVDGNIFFQFWHNVMKYGFHQIIRPIVYDSAKTARAFEDESIDFVFVDADHSYKGCMADIIEWYPKVKPGGWMGGHDYNQDVWKAVHDYFTDKEIENIQAMSFLVKK